MIYLGLTDCECLAVSKEAAAGAETRGQLPLDDALANEGWTHTQSHEDCRRHPDLSICTLITFEQLTAFFY